jgi:isopenicillin N synthase-like dioxygenase
MATRGRISDVQPAVAPFTEIPLIDLAPVQSGSDHARHRLAEEIRDACERVGFLYVMNHGVPEQLVEDMFSASESFFALPDKEKMKLRLGKHTSFRGYLPSGAAGGTAPGNRKEAFQIQSEKLPARPVGRAAELCRPNLWPECLPGFRTTLLEYYSEMEALADRLLRLFAIGLGIPEDGFAKHFREPIGMLRLLHYTPQDPHDPVIGSQPHVDGTAVTILAQDDAGGLEALNDRGEWTKVAPIPGTLVINLGETMKLWSDGRYASTPHRVINTSGRDRISIPFFSYPDFDTVIEPVITSAEHAREAELFGHLDPSRTMTSGEIILETWTLLYG